MTGGGIMSGFWGLFQKEVLRFWRVFFQTVFAPVVASFLYLLIFSHILEGRVVVYDGVGYAAFLAPGLAMMAVLQNGFANASSSLIQSKVTGNIVFLLLPPISPCAFFLAYLCASVVRALVVGGGVLLACWLLAPPPSALSFVPIVVFGFLGAVFAGALGFIAGLWAEKFDHLATFTSFIIMPLTFLSGGFYSVHTLPTFWAAVSKLNPFFYMIDGFRLGFVGDSDVPMMLSLAVAGLSALAVCVLALVLLARGYKIRA